MRTWLGLCAILWLARLGQATEVAYWMDSFETNAASRWTVNSTWHIGSPTAGPATNSTGHRAYSGTNCASTQGYTASNQDVRLICTNYGGTNFLLVPTADQYPRLRFWQWFNLANAHIYAQISTDGTTWTNLSSYLNIDSGGVWSRPSYDLTAYAGEYVQIAFHFISGGSGNGLGWFVDDVAVVTGDPTLSFPENFASGLGDWSVSAGTWEVGQPTSGPGAGLYSTNCAGTILAGNYGYHADTRLISPPFTVPANSPTLRFWQWYTFNNAGGYVEVSPDGGNTWNQIAYMLDVTTTNYWQLAALNLSAYGGDNVQIAFHFFSGGSGTAPGWYIDDISLAQAATLTVPTNQVINYGQAFTNTLTAKNDLGTNFVYTFAALSTNYVNVTTNGVLTWTNITAGPGTYTVSVKVTDNNLPPLSTTNSFTVTVLPLPTQLYFTNCIFTNHNFKFTIRTPWTNTPWRVLTATNLTTAYTNWVPIYTNITGVRGLLNYTDMLAPNYVNRYYRLEFP